MYIHVKGCLENDVKDAWEMSEEKRLVRGVTGLRSKVDGEVREKSLKCTLFENAIMISNIWYANFKELILSPGQLLDTLTIEIYGFYSKSMPAFSFSHFSGSLVI